MRATAKAVHKTQDVSQLKLELQNIFQNIQMLEQHQSDTKRLDPGQVEAKITQTDARLKHLESAPIEKFVRIIRKRQKNRKVGRKTRKAKQPKAADVSHASTMTPAATRADINTVARPVPTTSQKLNERLGRYHDAQRFLRTFELLKLLHLARGQDVNAARSFGLRFDRLRAIWNSILLDNRPARSAEIEEEDQWNAIFFGASEQTYYGEEQKLSDFMRIRHTWDSYLTRSNKYGSSIPIGWVLPRSDAKVNWQKYLRD